MKSTTKISPEAVAKSVRTMPTKSYYTQNYDYESREDEYKIVEKVAEEAREEFDVRRQTGYWHARSLFLQSYSFSEDKEGWRKKMKRKAKETNKKAKLALVDMGRKAMVRSSKFDVKLLALKVDPMSAAIVKCFVPCSSYRTRS